MVQLLLLLGRLLARPQQRNKRGRSPCHASDSKQDGGILPDAAVLFLSFAKRQFFAMKH